MPPVNQQRREALADAAIAIIAAEGTHGLSHRAVDEAAAVPRGTTSNYFRSRDALLEAAVTRVVQLHFDWINEQRAKRAAELDRDTMQDLLSHTVAEAVTTYRDRYRAMLELLLEGTRRPELHEVLARTIGGATDMIREVHRADGVEPSEEQVHLMRVCYIGVLTGYVALPEALQALSPRDTAKTLLDQVFAQEKV
ncbi:TetR/AcrR family transcriptional regulator [Kibdelosporangium lantanae]|uniref:TetR/AcrR family transcriptional regulator n=1 Tax=Kibdelosporangium lantanae TaxID=1497396 RepID=A0ABW3M5D0_9PSEU